MNTIYRVVWNASTNSWVVASEMAKGRKKASASRSKMAAVLATAPIAAVGGALSLASVVVPMTASASVVCEKDDYGSRTYNTIGVQENTCTSWVKPTDGTYTVVDAGSSSAHSAILLTGGRINYYLNNDGDTTKNVLQMSQSGDNVAMTGLAAGTLSATSLDAVNGSQLYATNQNVTNVQNTVNNITNGGGIKYFHTNSTGADSSATGSNAIAVGTSASSVGLNSIAMGTSSVSGVTGSAADYTTAIGSGAQAKGDRGVALGASSSASGSFSTAIGTLASATGKNATALGTSAVADRDNAVSVGSSTAQRQIIQVATCVFLYGGIGASLKAGDGRQCIEAYRRAG